MKIGNYDVHIMKIKCQLNATYGFFVADLIACSTCFGHHYAHHQELKKTKASNTTGSNHLYNTLELLMMGIMVPETC